MGSDRWPDPPAAWCPVAPAPPPETNHAGATNKHWRGIAALNALSGRGDYLENDVVGRRQVIPLYQRLDGVYGDGARLDVVQDTGSSHQHPDVVTAVAGLPRIEPVWVPTSAPWLTPIEKLWRWLRQDQVSLHRLAHDWATLRQRVNGCLDQFAAGSHALLRYVGLLGEGKLARALHLG
jgi:hypothetical protein